MDEQTARLVRCFASVFPNLPPGQIPFASTDTVAEWDSLATMTMVALLEQEFDAHIELIDLPELSSYNAVHQYLHERELILE